MGIESPNGRICREISQVLYNRNIQCDTASWQPPGSFSIRIRRWTIQALSVHHNSTASENFGKHLDTIPTTSQHYEHNAGTENTTRRGFAPLSLKHARESFQDESTIAHRMHTTAEPNPTAAVEHTRIRPKSAWNYSDLWEVKTIRPTTQFCKPKAGRASNKRATISPTTTARFLPTETRASGRVTKMAKG